MWNENKIHFLCFQRVLMTYHLLCVRAVRVKLRAQRRGWSGTGALSTALSRFLGGWRWRWGRSLAVTCMWGLCHHSRPPCWFAPVALCSSRFWSRWESEPLRSPTEAGEKKGLFCSLSKTDCYAFNVLLKVLSIIFIFFNSLYVEKKFSKPRTDCMLIS